jgi:hypothetical protein
MVNRILNSDLSPVARQRYLALLEHAAAHPKAPESVRDDARGFIEHQKSRRV